MDGKTFTTGVTEEHGGNQMLDAALLAAVVGRS